MDWGNTGTQRGGLRTLCSVDFTSLERIKNLYIRHILDIKSFGCWKYGHYRDRLSGLSFFSFSSLALIHLAEQPIRGISPYMKHTQSAENPSTRANYCQEQGPQTLADDSDIGEGP